MRKYSMLLAAGGALLTVPHPVTAQEVPGYTVTDAMAESAGDAALTPDQRAAYDAWPEGQKADYDGWPTDTKVYFWTLAPERQAIFWRLNDNDRLALTAMDEADRAAAWDMVGKKAQRATSPAASDTAPEPMPAAPPPPEDDYEPRLR